MITILGARGFVGSEITRILERRKIPHFTPDRGDPINTCNLGDVIYCIGLTGDFRIRPFDTVEAHVSKLSEVLQNGNFRSLTYVSSTRIYIHGNQASEESQIIINPSIPTDLFAASKVTGELLALNSNRKNIKIARLSNVFGCDYHSKNFLASIIKDALLRKKIILHSSADSAKDYISLQDSAELLISLATHQKSGIYNIATGHNVTNAEIVHEIQRLTNCIVEYDKHAEEIIFPEIDCRKITSELNIDLRGDILGELETIIESFRIKLGHELKSK